MNNKTVLVTGGVGYIGSWVTRHLLGAGFNVIVFDYLGFGSEPLLSIIGHPRFKFIRGDIRNLDELDVAMKGVDFVAHLAAIVGEAACNKDPDGSKKINMDGTVNVARMAKKNNVQRMVFFSTCSSYGVQDTSILANEETPVNPVSLYAETKIYAEKLIADELFQSNVSWCIFRPSTVHGPSARMRFDLIVNHFVKDAFKTGRLNIQGPDLWRPLMWVGEAGKAIELAFKADKSVMDSQIFNLGGVNGNYRKREIGEIIKNKYMPELQLEIGHSDPDLRSYCVDFSKINTKLGFALSKTLDEAIGDLFQLLRLKIITEYETPVYHNA